MAKQKRGKFIVLEGGDGSGKSTCVKYLKEKLPPGKFIFGVEPGGTEIGDKIRKILLDHSSTALTPLSELLLFFASRAQHLDQVIRPALKRGQHVINDRFSLSTLAYQIYGRERLDLLPMFERLEEEVVAETQPDCYIYLDLDPKIGLARSNSRFRANNRFDDEELAFHQRVRQGYLKSLAKYKHEIVDASGDIEVGVQKVLSLVKKYAA